MERAAAGTLGPGATPPPGPQESGGAAARPTWPRGRRVLLAVVLLGSVILVAVAWSVLRGPNEPRGAWGGHQNGRIPLAELCPLAGAPGQRLRCDAAAAYDRLGTAYRAHFGTRLCITDSYRPIETQVSASERKPELAAKPGTSNHGWALAVDLCGGANDFGTRQHQWLEANAPRFGWRQPGWAAQGGSKPEPWHWELGDLG